MNRLPGFEPAARALGGLDARLLVAVLVFLMVAARAWAAEADSLEYAVKATYLYKFAGYVEWPPKSFAAPDSPINLCIAGDDPFGAAIDTAVQGQRVGGRPVSVRRLKTVGRDTGCQILFIAGSDPQRAQMINAVRGTGVLTVTEGADAGSATGIINFVIRDNRVRFDIDQEAAARNGLSISSKLLSLALNLRARGQ